MSMAKAVKKSQVPELSVSFNWSFLKFGDKRYFRLLEMTVASCVLLSQVDSARAELQGDVLADVSFNSNFFRGAESVDVSRFANGNPILAGTYRVDTFANGSWIGRDNVLFRAVAGKKNAEPCFTLKQLDSMAVDTSKVLASGNSDEACRGIDQWLADASFSFDSSDLRLDLSLPQVSLRRNARGYVDPKYWDPGINAAVLGYDFNTYQMQNDGLNSTSSYLGIDSGLNIGDWQLRHRSSMTWQSGQGRQWQKIATYAQRNIAPWNSKLTIGETNTSGELFDSIGFRGVQLATDDRMLPDSLRGYAPVVRGVASTNALVEIRQNNVLIYQAPVAAGAFEFNDLYSTGYGGELAVTIIEADGRVHGFNVPYASVAQSLRPGTFRYSLTAGQVNERFLHDRPQFLQATVQRGFTNLVTGYGGVLASDGYGAGLIGAALNTEYGAFSLDLSHARTEIETQGTQSGQSAKLGYSKLLTETGTNFTVATYRYSTSGYLSFRDALNQREFASNGQLEFNQFNPARDSLDGPLDLRLTQQARDFAQSQALRRQRNSFELTVSQPLGEFGSVYVTGSKRNYWAGGGTDTQYQIGYNNHWGSLGYSVSASRTRDVIGRTGTEYYLSFSLPLGTGRHVPSFRSMVTRDNQGDTNTQVGLSGTAGVDSQFDYGVTATNSTRDGAGSSGSTNVQYRSPVATLRGSYGQGSGFQQGSVGVSGAMVAHGGGVTLAPQLGETMAIVEADAAKGARVVNSSGVRVDGNGYAAIPYLTPYNTNIIELDPTGLSNHVELQSSSQQVAPYAGAVVKVKFATVRGRAVFIRALGPQGDALPFAADVLDAEGLSVGIVSQASRLYVRGIPDSGVLTVKWGEKADQRCFVSYQLPPLNEKDEAIKALETLDAKCEAVGPAPGKA